MNTNLIKQYQEQLKNLFENIGIYGIETLEELEEKALVYEITLHEDIINGMETTFLWYEDENNSGLYDVHNDEWYDSESEEYNDFVEQFEI